MPKKKKLKTSEPSIQVPRLTSKWSPVEVLGSAIMDTLERSLEPLSSPQIARSIDDCFTIWQVRESLQLLQEKGILQKVDCDGWIITEMNTLTCETVENLTTRTNGLLTKSSTENPGQTVENLTTRTNGLLTKSSTENPDCPCPISGPSCVHINNHYYYQTGKKNTIIHEPPVK